MKWISIIPLIGGMSLGAKEALGTLPEVILSYKPFKLNDLFILKYWNYDNYHVINDDNVLPHNLELNNIDIVNAVCPCAGLSMLNSSNMGSDAPQNIWLYKTAEIILRDVKPQVFLGENAPGLFTNLGAGVVDNLRSVGKQYGYTFSMYKTDNSSHGVPQKRIRTFYFFWKGDKTPLLPWVDKPTENLIDFLSLIPENSLYHDKVYHTERLKNEILWKFLIENITPDTQELRSKVFKENPTKEYVSAFRFLLKNEKLSSTKVKENKKLIDLWCNKIINESSNENDITEVKKLKHKTDHIIEKINSNKNIWDSSMRFIKGNHINAVTSKNKFMDIHPKEDRFFTLREQMWLMKLPHDFLLDGTIESEIKNKNVIAQNVIVDSAKDVHKWAKSFIENKLELIETDFIKQNNINKKIIK